MATMTGSERNWVKDCELKHDIYHGICVDFLDITHKRIRDSLRRFVCGGVKYGPSPLMQRLLFASGQKALETGLLPSTLNVDEGTYHKGLSIISDGSSSSSVLTNSDSVLSKDGVVVAKAVPKLSFDLDSLRFSSQSSRNVQFFPFAREVLTEKESAEKTRDQKEVEESFKSSKWTINEAKDTEAFYSLDLQQRKAVEEAIKGPITLIEGPPGSGKTRIAAGIVEEKFGEQNFLVFSEMRGKHLYYYRP